MKCKHCIDLVKHGYWHICREKSSMLGISTDLHYIETNDKACKKFKIKKNFKMKEIASKININNTQRDELYKIYKNINKEILTEIGIKSISCISDFYVTPKTISTVNIFANFEIKNWNQLKNLLNRRKEKLNKILCT